MATDRTILKFPQRGFLSAEPVRVDELCAAAQQREDFGEYEQACELLESVWSGPGTRPDIEGLDDCAAAMLLMRAGSLTGWLGSKRQVEGWQSAAKDLLSEAAARFETAGALTDWGWSQKSLALCYWREGALSEARAIVDLALERLGDDPEPLLWISLQLILGMVAVLEGQNHEALHLYGQMAGEVETYGTDLLKALYHNGLENARENLGDLDGAIVEITAAIYYFEQGGYSSRQVLAINNLANLYRQAGSFEEAHAELDRAERLSHETGDDLHLAHLKDTRALVYLAERKFDAAERTARQSVSIFERGDEHALLARSLRTRARALARLNEPSSLTVYMQAYELAAERIGSRGASEIALEALGELAGSAVLDAHLKLDDAMDAFEESIIRAALDDAGGNITAAALRLGLKQQTLSLILKTRHQKLHPNPRGRPGRKRGISVIKSRKR